MNWRRYRAFNKAKALYLKKYNLVDSNLSSIRGLFVLDKIFVVAKINFY